MKKGMYFYLHIYVMKRSARNKNDISPFERVLACRGLEFIKQTLSNALIEAVNNIYTIDLTALKRIDSEYLYRTDEAPLLEPITFTCKVKARATLQSYPTFKV